MSDHHYPELDEKSLRLVARLAAAHPNYFTDPACPYLPTTKDLFNPKKNENTDEQFTGELPDTDQLLANVLKLSNELQTFGKGSELTSAEKNTYFRLSASLLKDLTDMRKELSHLKEHENFVSTILNIMDEICDADQKAEFRQRLEKFSKGEENETASA